MYRRKLFFLRTASSCLRWLFAWWRCELNWVMVGLLYSHLKRMQSALKLWMLVDTPFADTSLRTHDLFMRDGPRRNWRDIDFYKAAHQWTPQAVLQALDASYAVHFCVRFFTFRKSHRFRDCQLCWWATLRGRRVKRVRLFSNLWFRKRWNISTLSKKKISIGNWPKLAVTGFGRLWRRSAKLRLFWWRCGNSFGAIGASWQLRMMLWKVYITPQTWDQF